MKICTWNSQGNPLNDAIKLNILNHLLTIEQCNVVTSVPLKRDDY